MIGEFVFCKEGDVKVGGAMCSKDMYDWWVCLLQGGRCEGGWCHVQ